MKSKCGFLFDILNKFRNYTQNWQLVNLVHVGVLSIFNTYKVIDIAKMWPKYIVHWHKSDINMIFNYTSFAQSFSLVFLSLFGHFGVRSTKTCLLFSLRSCKHRKFFRPIQFCIDDICVEKIVFLYDGKFSYFVINFKTTTTCIRFTNCQFCVYISLRIWFIFFFIISIVFFFAIIVSNKRCIDLWLWIPVSDVTIYRWFHMVRFIANLSNNEHLASEVPKARRPMQYYYLIK